MKQNQLTLLGVDDAARCERWCSLFDQLEVNNRFALGLLASIFVVLACFAC